MTNILDTKMSTRELGFYPDGDVWFRCGANMIVSTKEMQT